MFLKKENALKLNSNTSSTGQGREESQWSAVSAAQLVASVIGSLCEAANTVIQVKEKFGLFCCRCVKV